MDTHMEHRRETDLLGSKEVPIEALYGIHTARALENFPLTGRRVHPEIVRSYGTVKLACLKTIHRLYPAQIPLIKQRALEQACVELSEGLLNDSFPVDALQGGAGTSLNMDVNEVIANLLTEKQLNERISPEAVLRLGSPEEYFTRKDTRGIQP
jgi:aspartate ammonia-lyase